MSPTAVTLAQSLMQRTADEARQTLKQADALQTKVRAGFLAWFEISGLWNGCDDTTTDVLQLGSMFAPGVISVSH